MHHLKLIYRLLSSSLPPLFLSPMIPISSPSLFDLFSILSLTTTQGPKSNLLSASHCSLHGWSSSLVLWLCDLNLVVLLGRFFYLFLGGSQWWWWGLWWWILVLVWWWVLVLMWCWVFSGGCSGFVGFVGGGGGGLYRFCSRWWGWVFFHSGGGGLYGFCWWRWCWVLWVLLAEGVEGVGFFSWWWWWVFLPIVLVWEEERGG